MNFKRQFKSLLTRISPKLNVKFNYWYYYKKALNLKKPQLFDEKIQWLKINEYNKHIYTLCADKVKVRNYVKSKGLENILNKIIGIYDNTDTIDWDSLPQKFVLKWNFGNGFNIICHDKKTINKEKVFDKLNKWGKVKSHLIHAELQYKDIPKKIICEKFLSGKTEGKLPDDFKVYCFNGIPKYILVCEGRNEGRPKFYFFDTNWQLQKINKDSINAPENWSLEKPKNLDKLLSYSKILSEDFKFVRVDFYIVDNSIYFGELTFSPSGGFDVHRMKSTDKLFGKLLEL